MNSDNLHEDLIVAVEDYDVDKVKELLSQGADPNYCRPKEMYEMYDSGYEHQPYSSLRMVVFRISDSLLDDDAFGKYSEIAKILIRHKADVNLALQLAESRYGKYEEVEGEEIKYLWKVYKVIMEEARKR